MATSLPNTIESVRWWYCFFGHHWTRWVETANTGIEQRVVGAEGQAQIIGHLVRQERKCRLCGKSQMRQVETRISGSW